ncbi:hypothetical protein VE01_03411 [Pseudogymnoascus verrucosus]|uniref:HMG box domain-containing protein n=1 Tax=Pseudogymnoascus verrucosus TaxID=342668 RepID=A0A1B8GSP4_9PEZI|nr:uncharacterized protein VE01_03411 [Pseudogymnoascus verrucosus]OBT98848.1 hypothetical protein VE01_03411 [Pseudogymnoascus verrucosus]
MTDLADIFDELGLTQYLDSFLDQGFDTWDTILDITEPDFDVLGVKLGHRRKLQRKIAATRGISHAQALASPKRGTPSLEDKQSEDNKGATPRSDGKDGNASTQPSGKRKYRRHPKPDENAPERPPSAYVIFSNKMREDLKGRPLSFTEIAKLVGENWQNLTPSEKEPYEQQAFAAKEKYTVELAEYRRTESYRTYSEYLIEFKAKQLQLQESNQEALNENSKRPKLENLNTSSNSTTTKSSTPSSLSREASLDSRTRVPSLGPIPAPWFPADTALQAPLPPSTKAQTSPGGPSTALPGYRDTVINPNLQTLAWRDHTRPPNLPIHEYNRQVEPKLNQSGILNAPETPTSFAQAFHNQPRPSLSSISSFSPPSLTSESTVSTQQSTSSSTAADPRQSTYFAPRIPLDPSRERPSFPMHPVFSHNSSKAQAQHFDTLPPIRHPSLSPQLPASISYNSQSGILAMDYSSINQASQRTGYLSPTRPPHRPQPIPLQLRHPHPTVPDDDNAPLDPVSALIRAGEIVSSQGRQQQQLEHAQLHQQDPR